MEWENIPDDKCDERNMPHVCIKNNSRNTKYKWSVEIDFIFVDDHKLRKEALEKLKNFINKNDIEYRLDKMSVLLGTEPIMFQSIDFREKKDAKKAAKKLADLAEQEDNWIHIMSID